jgi:hypothetical protein
MENIEKKREDNKKMHCEKKNRALETGQLKETQPAEKEALGLHLAQLKMKKLT